MAYAIFKTGGKQYKVAAGDVIEVEKLTFEDGTTQNFTDVLLVSSEDSVKTGEALSGLAVVAEIVAQTKADKVWAYKYKRRKGYHRTVGHRQKLTKIKITSIPA